MSTDPNPEPIVQFTGHQLVDAEGNKIGTVSDVVYGPDSDATHPTWLVVDVGLLAGSHYVPASQAFMASTGNLVASFDKHLVKASPRARRTHVLTRDDERELQHHYAMTR